MKPDMFVDPEGFQRWLNSEIKQHNREQSVNRSFNKLKQRNPKEFHNAYDALMGLNPKNPKHRKAVKKIYDADNPGKSLLQWWRGSSK